MFLPKTYEIPQAPSGYMRLEEGTNKFRVLSSAIVGYEYWNTDTKPVRAKEPWSLIPKDIKINDDGSYRINHFWAFVVWNYQASKDVDKNWVGAVQILEITQATIQRAMKIKIDNRNGDAKGYDFIVTRTGKGLLTDYDVDVTEASPLAPEIERAYIARPVNLEALYDGTDPFLVKSKEMTEEEVAEAVKDF